MEQGRRILHGMSMDEVRLVLGEPDRTHMIVLGQEVLTSWIYHAEPEPLCIWFDSADRVKLMSRNCAVNPAIAS